MYVPSRVIEQSANLTVNKQERGARSPGERHPGGITTTGINHVSR